MTSRWKSKVAGSVIQSCAAYSFVPIFCTNNCMGNICFSKPPRSKRTSAIGVTKPAIQLNLHQNAKESQVANQGVFQLVDTGCTIETPLSEKQGHLANVSIMLHKKPLSIKFPFMWKQDIL